MIEIDKNFEIPKIKTKGPNRKYPWFEMQVGDSFFVADVKTSVLSTNASAFSLKTGFKFTCRSVDGGVRVWRIA